MKNWSKFVTTLGLVITMTGCGSSTAQENNVYNLGDTIQTDFFDVTLKSLDFADSISVKKGNDFFTPVNSNSGRNLIAADGYKLLYFEFEYNFIGKEAIDTDSLTYMFRPEVDYQDYKIDTNYFIFWRETDGEWYNVASDIPWSVRKNYELDYADASYQYEPLEDKTYQARGSIAVPEKAYEDTSTPMTIIFQIFSSKEMKDGTPNLIFRGYKFNVRETE